MHQLVCADDSVHRTGLNAQCAADAVRLVNDGNLQWKGLAAGGVQGQLRNIKLQGKLFYTGRSAGWTAVDRSIARCNSLRIGQTALVATFGTLRLRQDAVDSMDERVQ